jgi:hypothetical protein
MRLEVRNATVVTEWDEKEMAQASQKGEQESRVGRRGICDSEKKMSFSS